MYFLRDFFYNDKSQNSICEEFLKFDAKNFLWDKLNQNWFTDSKIKNSSNFMDFFWDQSEYVIEWKYWLACCKYVCIYLYNMVRQSLQYIFVPILHNRCLGVVYVWSSLLQLTIVTRDLSQAEQIHSVPGPFWVKTVHFVSLAFS